ncbi:hypothetical protein HAX54_010218, partial [Datura stramonium]|nr:hypothetical protein [Datura stramonium]
VDARCDLMIVEVVERPRVDSGNTFGSCVAHGGQMVLMFSVCDDYAMGRLGAFRGSLSHVYDPGVLSNRDRNAGVTTDGVQENMLKPTRDLQLVDWHLQNVGASQVPDRWQGKIVQLWHKFNVEASKDI